MKKTYISLACVLALAATAQPATAEVTANIGVTSNYVWRGATQTDDGAAVSGGLDYAHESGIYFGTWASNVDFGNGGEVEWDLYGGYAGAAGDFEYDMGIFAYMYPDSDDANFYELAVSGAYGFFSAGIAYTFASDIDDANGSAEGYIEGDTYYWVGASFDLPEDFGINFTIGHYDFEDDGVGGADMSYTHGQVDLTKSAGEFGDFTFTISKAEEEANGGDDDIKVFASWTKEF